MDQEQVFELTAKTMAVLGGSGASRAERRAVLKICDDLISLEDAKAFDEMAAEMQMKKSA